MVPLRRYALTVVLIAGYCGLLYYASISREQHWLSVLLALAPVVAVILFTAWNSHYRYPMLVLAAAGMALSWLWLYKLIEHHYLWLYLLQHAGYNMGLAILFGRTLFTGQNPLVTRFAALVHDEMPPELIRYTRQVTLAWTLFFTSITLISIGLFVFASIETWSLFANILYPPLVMLMFVSEYQVRLRRLPHIRHATLIDSILSSARYFRKRS